MCRMLAIISRRGHQESLFEDFRGLSVTGAVLPTLTEKHNDGWGVAGYVGREPVYFGRSVNGADTDSVGFSQAVRSGCLSGSRIMVAHMRKASAGTVTLENTHPFIKDNWIFCHNGTVHNTHFLELPGVRYAGTTDSERIFHFILSRIAHAGECSLPRALRHAVEDIKARCGSEAITFFLTDGSRIIALRDFNQDESYYTIYVQHNDQGVALCSEPLSSGSWEAMKPGELLIADTGGTCQRQMLFEVEDAYCTSKYTGAQGRHTDNAVCANASPNN